MELLPTVNNSREGVKETRILALVPEFSNYEIYIHPAQKALIEELQYYNPASKDQKDDLLDMLSWNKVYWKRKPEEENKDFPDIVRYMCLEQPTYSPPKAEETVKRILEQRREQAYEARRGITS